MMELKDKGQKTNLLLDSPSESDVPDLELIPPTKTKKKKFRKFQSSRVSAGYGSPGVNSGGDGGGELILPRCWTSVVSLLFFVLCLGLGVLAWFTLGIYKELQIVKQSQSPHNQSAVYKPKIEAPSLAEFAQLQQNLEGKLQELETRIDSCHCSDGVTQPTKPLPLPITTATHSVQREKSVVDSADSELMRNLSATVISVQSRVEMLDSRIKSSLSTLLNVTSATTDIVRDHNKQLNKLRSCYKTLCSNESSPVQNTLYNQKQMFGSGDATGDSEKNHNSEIPQEKVDHPFEEGNGSENAETSPDGQSLVTGVTANNSLTVTPVPHRGGRP